MKQNSDYEILKETYAIVGRVEEKLDKMEIRVSNIEIWKAEFIGRLTAIVAIINLGIAVSFDWIKKQIFKDQI